jgi:hypothetical protein
LPVPAASGFYAMAMAAMILVIGVAWNPLSRLSNRGVNRFQATPVAAETAKVRS